MNKKIKELGAIKQEMMETEAEERWAKPDAAMPVLRDVKKEELEEEKKIIERRAKQLRLHTQTGVEKRKINDWNDTEVEEESEMEAVVKQEALLSVPPPRWLDEQTEIPKEEYEKSHALITKEPRDMFEYRVFLPHRSPNCSMTTTFGDLCDFLCEPFKHAPSGREKRQGLAGSAELPMGIKMQLYAALAAKKEQDVALEQLRKFVWDYRRSMFMRMFLAELPLHLKGFLNME